jgi:toxin ParE1/3/4
MITVVLSPRAQEDIDDIWNHTAREWGANQADVYVRQIRDATERLVDNPRIGVVCDDVRAGYLKLAVRAHTLFYRISGDIVDIVRILNQRMDASRQL